MKIIIICLLVSGTISLVIQNTFFGYIDEQGILRDSVFLPLGSFSLTLGVILTVVSGLKQMYTVLIQSKTVDNK
jgi:hypothetical protein